MRTSFCIIMAAVLSLCLFGVGSDMQESALQDTTPSDTVDRTANEIPPTASEFSAVSTEASAPSADVVLNQALDTITKETPDTSTEKSDGNAPASDNITVQETTASVSTESEELPIQMVVTTDVALPSRSADSVAGGLTDDSPVTVYDHNTGEYINITLREYVIGVVAAEMPMNFGEEALRAQAIAARTYAIYKLCRGGVADHPDAAICNLTSHCCAFVPERDATGKWGAYADAVLATARQAVTSTENIVIIYDESCICAAWHASSDGYTKSAEDVWGGHVAYLCSVSTEEDRHSAGHGVGMSQYGAKEMANGGALAAEILTHYYTDCTVVRVE